MRNRYLFNLAVILSLLFVIMVVIVIVDITRFANHTKPLIVLKTNHYDLPDGQVIQYISLGYEFLEFKTVSKKGWQINIGFTKKFAQEKKYRIVYDGEMYENCSEHSTLIYSDENCNYYLECVDAEKVLVEHDGNKYSITDALMKGIITINDISKSGYRVVVE